MFELLWDALEVAAQNVQIYFREKDKEIDPSLSHCIMRYVAKKYIEDNIWRIDGLVLENLPGNGLSLLYENYHLRIWKYAGRDLPIPGASLAKNAFLRQLDYQQLTIFSCHYKEEPNDNLVLLWDTDDEYQLKGLRLSRPKYESTGEEEVESEWSILLEHPVSTKDHLIARKDPGPVYDLPLEMITVEEEDANEVGG